MQALTRVNGNGEQQARVSDELRQLKQMSKGLRTKAMRSLLARHAAKRPEAKAVAGPEKARPAAAA